MKKLEEVSHEVLVMMLQHVSSLWFSSGFAVSMGEAAQPIPFEGVKQVVMSFCVAGVAVCDIPTCFITYRKSFCAASAMLLRRFQKMSCSLRGRRSTLKTSIIGILHGSCSTLDVSCCVFCANYIVRVA